MTPDDALYGDIAGALSVTRDARKDIEGIGTDSIGWDVPQQAAIEQAADGARSELETLADLLGAALKAVRGGGS